MNGLDQKFELLESLLNHMSSEEALEAFVYAMSTDDVRDIISYIARMHEIEIQRWNYHRWFFLLV